MPTPPFPFYASVANLKLLAPIFDLGQGLALRQQYSYIFSAPMLAFKKPDMPGMSTPGPWRAVASGYHHEAEVELSIPAAYRHPKLAHSEVARVLVILMRLQLDPRILMLVVADTSFADMASAEAGAANTREVHHRHFQLGLLNDPNVAGALPWVRDYWPIAADLFASNAAFRLAMETFEEGQFVQSSAMALVSIWGALEALFVSEKTELSFRLSVYLATYLKPNGLERLALQKKVSKLYGKRSAAAHGIPKHEPADITESFVLLRDAIVAIIVQGKAPTRADLDELLLGGKGL